LDTPKSEDAVLSAASVIATSDRASHTINDRQVIVGVSRMSRPMGLTSEGEEVWGDPQQPTSA
jgi:hypothetical protein